MKHPAKYSKELLPIFNKYLHGIKDVLDPFGGTGKLLEIVRVVNIGLSTVAFSCKWLFTSPFLFSDF